MKILYYCVLVLTFVVIWVFYGFLVSIIFEDPGTIIFCLYAAVTITTFRGAKALLHHLFFKDK